jgi:hypothetical protein
MIPEKPPFRFFPVDDSYHQIKKEEGTELLKGSIGENGVDK